MKTLKLELSGKRFGHITVNGRAATSRNWIGTCDCSPDLQREFNGSRLAAGKITHCGCQRASHGHTSGKTRSPTYISWQNMIARCKALEIIEADGTISRTRKHDHAWLKFENFQRDMGDRPSGKTLDRINTLGHYGKDNCRWATRQQQDFNRTNTKMYCADPETQNIIGSALEWAEWYTRSTNVPMTVAEFQTIIKFITPEQFFCAMNPLSTYKQLKQRHQEEKNKKFAAMWSKFEEDEECPDTGQVEEKEDIDTGYVPE